MEFKDLVFWVVLGCCAWAISISGLITVDQLGSIEARSELPSQEDNRRFGNSPLNDQFRSIISVLNIALPIAFLGIITLGIIYCKNPIGMWPMLQVGLLFVIAWSQTMDAMDTVQATTFNSINARVWWL